VAQKNQTAAETAAETAATVSRVQFQVAVDGTRMDTLQPIRDRIAEHLKNLDQERQRAEAALVALNHHEANPGATVTAGIDGAAMLKTVIPNIPVALSSQRERRGKRTGATEAIRKYLAKQSAPKLASQVADATGHRNASVILAGLKRAGHVVSRGIGHGRRAHVFSLATARSTIRRGRRTKR